MLISSFIHPRLPTSQSKVLNIFFYFVIREPIQEKKDPESTKIHNLFIKVPIQLRLRCKEARRSMLNENSW